MIYNLVLNITAARHTNIFTEALFSMTDFRLQVGFVGHKSSIVQNVAYRKFMKGQQEMGKYNKINRDKRERKRGNAFFLRSVLEGNEATN